MTISVIIVNWNSKDYLRAALRSLDLSSRAGELEVIVVDGASFDGCGEMLKAEFPSVHFIQSPDNIGFGRCNNLGSKVASGKYLLLLNPDTELVPGALDELLNQFPQLPNAGLVGPRLLNADRSLQTSCVQAFPTPINQALDSDWLRSKLPRSKLWGVDAAFRAEKPEPVEAVSGACMLISADVFAKVGGFSPSYFMYGEDMDLCAKVHQLGLCVYHVPRSEVVHYGGGSSSADFSKVSAVLLRHSVYQFIRSHQGVLAAACYRVLMGVTAIVRLGLLIAASPMPSHRLRASRKMAMLKWRAILRWSAGLEEQVLRRYAT